MEGINSYLVATDTTGTANMAEKTGAAIPQFDGKILVTEDNEINQNILMHILEFHGFKVTIASTAEEALLRVKDEEFNLILMDIQLPGMDGVTAASKIREMNDCPNAKIPILAMTAHLIEDCKKQCLVAGMNDFLNKPVDRKELIEKIASLLELIPVEVI